MVGYHPHIRIRRGVACNAQFATMPAQFATIAHPATQRRILHTSWRIGRTSSKMGVAGNAPTVVTATAKRANNRRKWADTQVCPYNAHIVAKKIAQKKRPRHAPALGHR